MKTRSALILTWSGYQDQEVIYPYYRLLGAGYEVSIVGDKKDNLNRIYGIFGVNMPCHFTISDLLEDKKSMLDKFDLLILPGGVKALEKLRLEKGVIDFIVDWNRLNKVISSTCHGAQLLISSKIISNKKVAGYYSIEDDINNAGAEYSREPFVISENIISSPHYDHMGIWMEKTLELHRDWK